MCKNCKVIGQRTFGAIVGLAPVEPINSNPISYSEAEDIATCDECGGEYDGADLKVTPGNNNFCEECYDEHFVECNDCNEVIDKDASMLGPDDNDYCESCHNERFGYCEGCEETFDNDDLNSVDARIYINGRNRNVGCLCNDCRDEYMIRCEDCRCWESSEESHSYNNGSICQGCYENGYFYCEGCNDVCSNDNMSSCEDGCYCDDCHTPDEDSDDDDSSVRVAANGKTYFAANRFAPETANYVRTGSARTFGVELETATCAGYEDFAGKYHFAAKPDGSIDGEEFASAVLYGDEGLDAITDFCDAASEADFTVDDKCGYHAHFGASDLCEDQMRAVLCAYNLTYNVWSAFVSETRRARYYCAPSKWTCDDVINAADLYHWMGKNDRYQWFNTASYSEHTTLEVRLHPGAISGSKVANWVVAHIRFIDAVSKMTVEEVRATFEGQSAESNFAAISEIWNDAELTNFYAERARKFGNELAPFLSAAA